MSLDDLQKQERRNLLTEARVPDKYFNKPLSKFGVPGGNLRAYVRSDYASDAVNRVGAIVVNKTPGIAASFSRDIVILGASLNFYYLQTFANQLTSIEALPQSFTIDWFEQDGVPSPFAPSERFRLETAIMQMIDDGIIFYLFTSVHPEASTWWSKNFIQALLDNCRLIEVSQYAADRDNKRTTFSNSENRGQKNLKGSKRVAIR